MTLPASHRRQGRRFLGPPEPSRGGGGAHLDSTFPFFPNKRALPPRAIQKRSENAVDIASIHAPPDAIIAFRFRMSCELDLVAFVTYATDENEAKNGRALSVTCRAVEARFYRSSLRSESDLILGGGHGRFRCAKEPFLPSAMRTQCP